MPAARRVSIVVLVAALVACLPSLAIAQSSTAALRGTVLDPQGQVITGATVTVVNVGTNQRREVISSAQGFVSLDQLPPAVYEVSAMAQGFAPFGPVTVVLNVGDERALRLTLSLAGVQDAVRVEGTAGRVQTSPAVGTLVEREFIANMPLSGRTLQSLFDLTPGVLRTAPGTGGQFVVNGQRSDANYYMVDGVSANVNVSVFAAGPGVAGTLPTLSALNTTNTLVSVDALQEFRIETSTYAPEFGRTPGGQVSLVTRSGSNIYTGTAFEYFRHEKMDATDYFAKRSGLAKPPTRQHDFGGVLGGPIRLPGYDGRNRSFFFASYEGLRLNQPQVANTVVPSLSARNTATGVMRQILGVWPLPTGPETLDAAGRPTGSAPYQASYGDPSVQHTTSLRVDQSLGQYGSIFARANLAPSRRETRLLGTASVSETYRSTNTVTAGHNWARGRVANDLRVNLTDVAGRTSSRLDDFGGAVPVDAALVLPSFVTTETASLTFQMDFGSLFPSFTLGKTSDNSTVQWNVVDNFTIQAGRHAMKVGVDYRRLAVDLVANTSVSPNFPTLAQFNTGVVPSLSVTARKQDIRPIVENFSLYAQDTWRVRERLTLTYGVRWDLNPAPKTPDDRAPMTLIGTDSPATLDVAPVGTPLFPTRYNNFAPRLGASYVLRQTPGMETVLRGGGGLYYDLGTSLALFGYEGYPHRITVNYPNVTFPLNTASLEPPVFRDTPPYTTALGYVSDFVSPRTWQWNATVEQSLGRSQSLTVAYVGAAGRKLARAENYTRPNARFGDTVRIMRNSASSDYKALQVQYIQRPLKGLQGMASYTLSHSTDTGSTSATGNNIALTLADIDTNRADSDFDVRHNFAMSLTYAIPAPPGPPLVQKMLGGFSVDTLVKARSGSPVDVLGRGTTAPYNGTLRPNLVPGQPLYIDDPAVPGGRRFNAAAFTLAPVNVQGDVPRNFLRGFGAHQVDLALRREIPIGGVRLQLRGEVFNLFNTVNFGNPTASINSALFGQATTMLNRSLNGLNALYEMGGPRSGQLAVKLLF